MIGSLGLLRRLLAARSGVAAVEFAMSLPVLLTAGLFGTETANLAVVHMRVGQLAVQIADNAARIGDTSQLSAHKIYESDIDDLMLGSNIQAGKLGLFDHGRVIISSLEVVPGTADKQYIHWQRCKGTKHVNSAYGAEGAGLTGTLNGMGPPGEEVQAVQGDAVIYVEVTYDYQPLMTDMFTRSGPVHATAAFNVRDSRDLSQIYQRDPTVPDPVLGCAAFNSF
ncbi:TadE/TadG family type IV pilus assembly protein [Novosphingobium lentum]|uniref:TadE/TadG family type IV pilus assembly protein n=1 Tax=Novosphingobium lentum TaxID=145287 RepID=UPI00082DEAFF|nr:TadE family protein [Novosphingobium lentum]